MRPRMMSGCSALKRLGLPRGKSSQRCKLPGGIQGVSSTAVRLELAPMTTPGIRIGTFACRRRNASLSNMPVQQKICKVFVLKTRA